MTADQLIAAALRRESPTWPAHVPGLEVEVRERADDHGVTALLAVAPGLESWPRPLRTRFREVLRVEAAIEAARREELIRIFAALNTSGARPLLLKGAQLAYTHYPRPWLRSRLDTDLLVRETDRRRADEALRGLGYEPATDFSGDLVSHQFQYCRTTRLGLVDHLDLHWKIANPHVFALAFSHEELERAAVAIEPLGTQIRGLSDVHALVLACVHRVAHHGGSDRLIWLYDIHLLAAGLPAAGRREVEAIAAGKGLRTICGRSIAEAQARFGTSLPTGWPAALEGHAALEPSARFLRSRPTKFGILRSDISALPGWRPRIRLVLQHLFPPAAYIRRTYRIANPALIPFAYGYRILAGAARWFR